MGYVDIPPSFEHPQEDTTPLPTWALLEPMCLPLPARFTGSPPMDLVHDLICTRDLWAREAWAPASAQAPHRAPPPACVVGNTHPQRMIRAAEGSSPWIMMPSAPRAPSRSPKQVTRHKMQRFREVSDGHPQAPYCTAWCGRLRAS